MEPGLVCPLPTMRSNSTGTIHPSGRKESWTFVSLPGLLEHRLTEKLICLEIWIAWRATPLLKKIERFATPFAQLTCCLDRQRSLDVSWPRKPSWRTKASRSLMHPKQSNGSQETKSTLLGNIIGFVGVAKRPSLDLEDEPYQKKLSPFSNTTTTTWYVVLKMWNLCWYALVWPASTKQELL